MQFRMQLEAGPCGGVSLARGRAGAPAFERAGRGASQNGKVAMLAMKQAALFSGGRLDPRFHIRLPMQSNSAH